MCFGTSSGRWTQLLHFGPIITIVIISIVSYSSIFFHLVWWPPTSVGSYIDMGVFLTWVAITMYNYFKAIFVGPGFVPLGWKPPNPSDEQYLQFCNICKGYKSPRSHHCRKCNRCVMKMDHHCPWINTCCGHHNHANFIYFLFFAPIGCLHASVILSCSIYRALFSEWHMFFVSPFVRITLFHLLMALFAVGLAIGVTLAVGFLLCVQMRSVIKNETGIEGWIIAKAISRPRSDQFVYPYNLGKWNNIQEVFDFGGEWQPKGTGYTWNVVPGCNQFALTNEQLEQKDFKRQRSVPCRVERSYNGRWLPLSFGCRVLFSFPCSDEQRMPVREGQWILVSRFRRHWIYGALLDENQQPIDEQHGWLPRKCIREPQMYDPIDTPEKDADQTHSKED